MHFRTASLADVPLLARMNQDLREDERSRYSLSPADLEARKDRLLKDEGYTAVLFEIEDKAAAYALYREVEGGIHLRQFFVSRDHRRRAQVVRRWSYCSPRFGRRRAGSPSMCSCITSRVLPSGERWASPITPSPLNVSTALRSLQNEAKHNAAAPFR